MAVPRKGPDRNETIDLIENQERLATKSLVGSLGAAAPILVGAVLGAPIVVGALAGAGSAVS